MSDGQDSPPTLREVAPFALTPAGWAGQASLVLSRPPDKTTLTSPAGASGLWFVAMRRTDLAIVANVATTTSSDVPAELRSIPLDAQHLLLCASVALGYTAFPQQDLYAFLMACGGGASLSDLEQLATTAGSATGSSFLYCLAGVMGSDEAALEGGCTENYGAEPARLTGELHLVGSDGGDALWSPTDAVEGSPGS